MAPGETDEGASPSEPVKLLEVNEDTIPCGIIPVYFRSRPESAIDYPSIIVEITPGEYEQLGRELALPEGWRQAGEIERAAVAVDQKA